jgi:hypothetical protein
MAFTRDQLEAVADAILKADGYKNPTPATREWARRLALAAMEAAAKFNTGTKGESSDQA